MDPRFGSKNLAPRAEDETLDPFARWVRALEVRHLADVSLAEVGRGLRALSSCYVERRGRLAEGGALDGAGKRAAFALFYGPVHFIIVRNLVKILAVTGVSAVYDLGCGIGSAGAAWALACDGARVTGLDRHPWAVAEATWTYRFFKIPGHARRADITRVKLRADSHTGIIAAYAINELPPPARDAVLQRLLEAGRKGAAVIVVEPISRRLSPWWAGWAEAFAAAGGRSDEWRFEASLPDRPRQLARAAGLRADELTARTLWLAGR